MFNSPQRLAWVTLLGAFFIFCLVCLGTIRLTQWVLFELPIDIDTTLFVSRGTIGVAAEATDSEIVVRERFEINPGDRISTDSLSQGHLTFRDPSDQDNVIATIQILASSELKLTQSTRPRFGLGDNPYHIRLEDVQGRIEVVITSNLERNLVIEIEGSDQAVRLDESGNYRLQFTEDGATLTVQRGTAVLINEGRPKLVTAGETAVASAGTVTVTSAPENILNNSFFAEVQDNVALGWGCDPAGTLSQPNDPLPQRQPTLFQGRSTMHIWRLSDRQVSEARIGCQQPPLDVANYASLKLRTSFYLVSQSLSGCGVQGTECPLILLMDYIDENGTPRTWLQGFYIFFNEGLGGRTRCDNCPNEHIQVNAKAWYVFESEDFVIDRPNERPVLINGIRFYSSGHQYEIYVSELSLLGVKNPAPAP